LVILFPLVVGDAGHGEEGVAGFDVGAEAVHAADGVEVFSADIGAFWIDEFVIHIDGDDFANDDAGVADFHGGDFAAFESGRGFEDSGWFDLGGRSRVEFGHFHFVDTSWEIDGADVHALGDILVDDVNDEFTGVADILCGVLADDVGTRTIADANGDDGRIDTEIVVGAERGGVDFAFEVDGGNERDGARCDKADEEVVGEVWSSLGEVEIHW
jgi:hypothetical protein